MMIYNNKEKIMKKVISILLISIICISIFPTENVFAGTSNVEYTSLRYWGRTRYETSFDICNKLNTLKKAKYDNIVVACGSNYPDALSGGYFAFTKNAPVVLVSEAKEKDVTNIIKSKMKAGGTVYLLGGTGVIRKQYETNLIKAGYKVKRLWGSNRYGTNLAILKETKSTGDLIVVNGAAFEDALSAGAVKKPMMIVGKTLTTEQKTWLKNAKLKNIYIVGNTNNVTANVEKALKSYGTVKRVSGSNKWNTSKAVADYFFPKAKTIVLAQGNNFPDGLSGAPMAMHYNAPIVLVDSKNWKHACDYVFDKDIYTSVALGGTAVVPDITIDNVMSRGTKNSNSSKVTWNWSKDYSKCTATAVDYILISNTGKTKEISKTVNATITTQTKAATETKEGAILYTAKAKFGNFTHRDTKTVSIPKTAHVHNYKPLVQKYHFNTLYRYGYYVWSHNDKVLMVGPLYSDYYWWVHLYKMNGDDLGRYEKMSIERENIVMNWPSTYSVIEEYFYPTWSSDMSREKKQKFPLSYTNSNPQPWKMWQLDSKGKQVYTYFTVNLKTGLDNEKEKAYSPFDAIVQIGTQCSCGDKKYKDMNTLYIKSQSYICKYYYPGYNTLGLISVKDFGKPVGNEYVVTSSSSITTKVTQTQTQIYTTAQNGQKTYF